jgi:hypothetical protein
VDDKTFIAQKKRVMRLINYWMPALKLFGWNVRFVFSRDESPPDAGAAHTHQRIAAYTCSDWRYMEAAITFLLPEVAQLDDEQLEHMFLHELMHVYLDEMRCCDKQDGGHEERVASWLASSLVHARNHLTRRRTPPQRDERSA